MDENRDSLISDYFHEGLSYDNIVTVLRESHGIEISLRHLHRVLRSLTLRRRKYSDARSIVDFVANSIEHSGRNHGYRIMRQRCLANGLSVRTQDVATVLRICNPTGVQQRTARRFTRRSYFSPGPNYLWHIDGYDKLKPYGLCIHGCICGFSRKMLWLNVYKTNNNPHVVASYYLETVDTYGGTPYMVRRDFGTENVLVREMQRNFRRTDSAYISGASTQNQRIECWWGYLRRQHIQYWMDLFKGLQEDQVFSANELDKNLVRFCFLALIQDELNLAVSMWDNHTIRPQSNSISPYGQPRRMFNHPTLWNTRSYLCPVSLEDIDTCRVQVEPRSLICCDDNVYDICINIMRENNLVPTFNAEEAVVLYRRLRANIDTDLNI